MKKQIIFFAILMMALVLPQNIFAFYYTYQGKTLYYEYVTNASGSAVKVSGYYDSGMSGSLVIPSTVTYNNSTYTVIAIGDDAFGDCEYLTSVTIPNTVTSIGYDAFHDCTGLTSVTIPNTVTSIGDEAFYDCTGLTSVTIPNSVTSLGNRAFMSCTGLTSIIISNSVTTINDAVFMGCNSLSSVTIGSSVDSICILAFAGCTSLASIIFPNSVTYIGEFAFEGSGLTSVTLGGNISYIAERAFWECDSLTSVTIGRSVTFIGSNVFHECPNLTSVEYNADSCHFDGDDNPFYNCLISYIAFGDSVRIIPDKLFFGICQGFPSSMTSVTIPSTVTYIGESALSFTTTSLITFNMLPIEAPIIKAGDYFNHGSFGDEDNVIISIPCGSYESYYNGSGWQDYRECLREPEADINFVALSVNDSIGEANIVIHHGNRVGCDSTTIVLATANEGYHFTHWSNGNTINPDTLQLMGDSSVMAYFEPNTYSVTVSVNNPSMGNAIVNGGISATVMNGDTVTLTAIANEGYNFLYWNDYEANSTRTVIVTSDTAFIAYFEVDGGTDGIGDVDDIDANVSSCNGQIIVESADGNMVTLYDATGRMLATKQDEYSPLHFDVPTSGTYLVKVGNYPARKVVLIR